MTITITSEGPSLVDSVRHMRRAQREYLLTKDHVVLARAKRLEREVDEQLEVFEMELTRRQAREKYPKLFPDSNGA